MDNKMNIGIGRYKLEMTEETLLRLKMLEECSYMEEDLQRVIDKIIELYEGEYNFGEIISAEESMKMIVTLYEAKKDYQFLTQLKIEKNDAVHLETEKK